MFLIKEREYHIKTIICQSKKDHELKKKIPIKKEKKKKNFFFTIVLLIFFSILAIFNKFLRIL